MFKLYIEPAMLEIQPCCSAFTLIADDDMRKEFQVENSRYSVNKSNPFANVAMKAAYSSSAPWLEAVITFLESNLEMV